MQPVKERNPYLKRISSEKPHTYSFDLMSGKHVLVDESGKYTKINKTGTHYPRFKGNFSGVANYKERYKEAERDPSCLHFAPSSSFTRYGSYYTPMPRKFAGYTQFPYKLQYQYPPHMRSVNETFVGKYTKASQYVNTKPSQQTDNLSFILQKTATKFAKEGNNYFTTAFNSMTESRPLAYRRNKNCYNYKCRNLQHFTFDEKSKIEAMNQLILNEETQGIYFYERSLRNEQKETKLLSTMALTVTS